MNLTQIRTAFKEISGRYDLVNEDDTDNGANFYINEAARWLDRKSKVQKSYASYLSINPVNTLYVQMPYCRAIKEVWAATDEGRWQLEKQRLQDLIAGYLGSTPAELTTGAPLYYSPALTRYIPEDMTPATLATFTTYLEVTPVSGYEYNAILLNVPVDRQTLIDVRGLFYSISLVEDEDENYWSSYHPMLLVLAASRLSYVNTNNLPALKIAEENLNKELAELGMDFVEEMIAEADKMEG